MAEYSNVQAMAVRLIAQKGFVATVRSVGTVSDPVTGSGAVAGDTRNVQAVRVSVDRKTFPETLIERATCMLICSGEVSIGEAWIDSSAERPIIATMVVEPDNSSHIITKALIGA